MIVIRSYDVNKPGTPIEELKGGVLGGSILEGILKVNDIIEIRPGRIIKDKDHEILRCIPIITKIETLKVEDKNILEFSIPGGLIGIGTTIDPTLSKSDSLSGNVIGYPKQMPDVFKEVDIS